MRIVQVIASLDNPAAGPSYSVMRLAQALAARRQCVELLSTTRESQAFASLDNRFLKCEPFIADGRAWKMGGYAFSRELGVAIERAAVNRAVLHSHGLWLMPNFYSAMSAKKHNGVHVVSPRGMLAGAALSFSRWRKRLVWALFQRHALHTATCLHATSWQELEEIRELGINVPVAVVPNGVDLPELTRDTAGSQIRKRSTCRTVLYLGRTHPKKGLGGLIEAWGHLEPQHPDWRLRLAGPSEDGCRQQLETQASELGLARVSFSDGLFGAEKSAAYEDAELFVLPTRNENFGMVVAEALSHATPVICTRGAPWQGLETHDCGWWIDHGVRPLIEALGAAMRQPARCLADKGQSGRDWMARSFSWQHIAHDMEKLYRWCDVGGQRPDFVDVRR